MKKRALGILLSLALMFGLLGAMGATAYAEDTYEITKSVSGSGSVSVTMSGSEATNAGQGAVLTLTATPEEGYSLSSITAVATLNFYENLLSGSDTVTGDYFKVSGPKAQDGWQIYGENREITVSSLTGDDLSSVSLTVAGNGGRRNAGDLVASCGELNTYSTGEVVETVIIDKINSPSVTLRAPNATEIDQSWTFSGAFIRGKGKEELDLRDNTDNPNVKTFTMKGGPVQVNAIFEKMYPLWVGGVQVTPSNADDVLADDEVNKGKVSFTPATDGAPAKLTLKGATITKGYEYENILGKLEYGILYESESIPLTIALEPGTENTIKSVDCGIYSPSRGVNLCIEGDGTLTTDVDHTGINAGEITIEGSTINVSANKKGGITASDDVIINDADLTVKSDFSAISSGLSEIGGITINGGTLDLFSNDTCIDGRTGVTINNANVTATTDGKYKNAIFAFYGEITINGSKVKATATNTGAVGIYVCFNDIIIGDGCEVTAVGSDHALLATAEGLVKNAIAGTGWTNTAGTAGRTAIAISTKGQDLEQYKKVQFPEAPEPTPDPTKVSGMLLAKATAKGKTSMAISWSKVKGASGYDIFLAKCKSKKSKCKKVKTLKGNKTFKWTKKKLKKKTEYKLYVKAYIYKNGKKSYMRTSPVIHAYTGNVKGKYTNAKSVTVKKAKVSLKKGKTYKISAKVNKVKKNKKLMPKSHVATLRYLTSNSKVATVSKSGKITAKDKGTCTIYALAHNGVSKNIKVTVK